MHKDDDFRIVDSFFVSKLFDIHMQCNESSCLGENSRSKLILEVVEAVWTDGHPDSRIPRLDPSQG